MNDLISIIIPLYNKETAIANTISSVLKQTYINWELIVVDDGSTDRSGEIVKSITDKRILYFIKENGGVSSARNYGIKKANGKWIVFLDADDYFLPDALNILYRLVVAKKTLISTANFIIKKEEYEYVYCRQKTEVIISNNYKAWFLRSFFPRTGAALFNYAILKKHLFDENLSRYEDAKSLFDIFREHKIAYSPNPVMVYSLDNTGLSHRSNNVQKDFIFSMNFENKSWWEKIALCELLLQGYKLYPEHKNILNAKYEKYLYLIYMTKILFVFRGIYNNLLRK